MQNSRIGALFSRSLHHRTEHLHPGDPIEPPIALSSVYFLPGDPQGPYQYARWSNPTWTALEEALSILEDAETVIFSSGMASISAVFATQLKPGDSVLLPSDGYYSTRAMAEKLFTPVGVKVTTCPTRNYDSQDLTGFRLVLIESPSNPGLDVCDIRKVVANAKRIGALVIADNTTSTPLGQRPLDLGADAVVVSDTKATNGHSDVLLGHVASRDAKFISQIREYRTLCGAIPGAFEAWLVHRGLETLEVRFERMCSTAAILAERLANHPKVQRVSFPGLSSHPAHSVAKDQMIRFGALIAVTFPSRTLAERFINECHLIRPTTSFGGVHTSAECRARWGENVPEGFVRLSVGCEPTEVLWQAMSAVLDTL